MERIVTPRRTFLFSAIGVGLGLVSLKGRKAFALSGDDASREGTRNSDADSVRKGAAGGQSGKTFESEAGGPTDKDPQRTLSSTGKEMQGPTEKGLPQPSQEVSGPAAK